MFSKNILPACCSASWKDFFATLPIKGKTPTVPKNVFPISLNGPSVMPWIIGTGKPLSLAKSANSFCFWPLVPNNFLPSFPNGPKRKGVKSAAPEFHINAVFISSLEFNKISASTSFFGTSAKSSDIADAM